MEEAYDLAGSVQTLTDAANSGQVQSFGYDWLDRLTSAATNAVGVGQYSHTYAYNAIGNITSYNGNAYTYGSQPHAVTAAFGNSYGYDAVGNQTSRTIGGVAYTQSFDYDMVPRQRDNRLVGVAGGSVSATFLYDAEGNRVKGTVNGVTTVYLAGLYEYQNGAVTKYYEGGAMRRTGYATDNGVFYIVSDHLRSTSVLVNRDGTVKSRNYYYPYGGNRGGSAFSGVTTKRFTGQYHEQGLPGGEGLSYYNARWYDAQVGVFISADTLVPSPLAPQTLSRYAYVGGNPLRYTDPTGHMLCADCDGGGGGYRTRSQPKVSWPSPFGFTSPVRPQPPTVKFRGMSVVVQPRASAPISTSPPFRLPANGPQFSIAPPGTFDTVSVLQYRLPAYLRPRLETWHGVAGDAKVAEASGGLRRVRIWNGVFDWSKYDDYWEYVVDISAQYQVFEGGAECSQGKCAPAIGLDLEIVFVGLQPGNIMVGGKWGPAGAAVGFDFFWGSNRFLIASPATILAKGPTALGQAFFGKNARFLGVVETFNGIGGRSAIDKAQGFLNQYGFSYEVAR